MPSATSMDRQRYNNLVTSRQCTLSVSLVIHCLRWTVSGQVKAHVVLTCTKRGLAQSPSCDCGQRQTMNHTVDTCSVPPPINKIWRRTESTWRSGWWRNHMAVIYSDCSLQHSRNNNRVPLGTAWFCCRRHWVVAMTSSCRRTPAATQWRCPTSRVRPMPSSSRQRVATHRDRYWPRSPVYR